MSPPAERNLRTGTRKSLAATAGVASDAQAGGLAARGIGPDGMLGIASASGKTSRNRLVLCGILLILAGVGVAWAHGSVLSAQAVSFDDDSYLFQNRILQAPSWKSAGECLREVLKSSSVEGYYEPLTLISLMLDVRLGGEKGNLRPFHRTSLALHVANTLLLVVLLYLLFGEPWVAALVGVLFGVHPLTVEPIAWVWERKTLLSTFFSLWSLILYARYVRGARTAGASATAIGHPCRSGAYLAALVLFVPSLMSKPTSTPLPLVLLLLDYWPFRRFGWRALREKVPFFLLAGLSAAVTIVSTARNARVTLPGEHSIWQIPLKICYLMVFYLQKIFWPTRLSSVYPLPEPLTLSQPVVLLGVLGTTLLILAIIWSLRWTRAILAGSLIFLLSIGPTLGIVGYSWVSASDKYLYMPSVGLLIILACFLGRLWTDGQRSPGRSVVIRMLLVAIFLAVLTCEVGATRRYLAMWQDTERLYRHMLSLAPESAKVHNNLGLVLAGTGRRDEAMVHYRHALRLRPDDIYAHNNLGVLLADQGRIEEAVAEYEQALKLDPDDVRAHNNLGVVLTGQGRADEAMMHYRHALKVNANDADAYNNLGRALAQKGELEEGIVCFRQALRLKPRKVEAYNNLGTVLAIQGRPAEATTCFRQALQLKPDDAKACNNLGNVLSIQGRLDEAIEYYRRALRLKPDYLEAHNNLGSALAQQGKLDEATEHYREVVGLQPLAPDAHRRLGELLRQRGRTDEADAEYREALRIDPRRGVAPAAQTEVSKSMTGATVPAR